MRRCTSGTRATPLPRRDGHPHDVYSSLNALSPTRFTLHHRPAPRTVSATLCHAEPNCHCFSELSSPHSCQTQFASYSGTPMPQASLPQAMLRATLQLHLAIPSNPIQLPFHRPGGSCPGQGPVLPSVRCHHDAFRIRVDPLAPPPTPFREGFKFD